MRGVARERASAGTRAIKRKSGARGTDIALRLTSRRQGTDRGSDRMGCAYCRNLLGLHSSLNLAMADGTLCVWRCLTAAEISRDDSILSPRRRRRGRAARPLVGLAPRRAGPGAEHGPGDPARLTLALVLVAVDARGRRIDTWSRERFGLRFSIKPHSVCPLCVRSLCGHYMVCVSNTSPKRL